MMMLLLRKIFIEMPRCRRPRPPSSASSDTKPKIHHPEIPLDFRHAFTTAAAATFGSHVSGGDIAIGTTTAWSCQQNAVNAAAAAASQTASSSSSDPSLLSPLFNSHS